MENPFRKLHQNQRNGQKILMPFSRKELKNNALLYGDDLKSYILPEGEVNKPRQNIPNKKIYLQIYCITAVDT